jgi:1-acyl-sn-glycerol-3-phosphate acyltransferase
MVFVRSLLFNLAFYLTTAVMLIVSAPGFLLLPERQAMEIVRAWGWIGTRLLRYLGGVRCEVRGLDNVPPGGCLIAAKHQSAFETFALLPLLTFPTFVLKRELQWLPLFGWYTMKTGMVAVDRDKGAAALRKLTERARQELAKGRPIVIFPEGTRRAPGAPPDYKSGIGLLYKALGAPVVPVALNSGLYWPRRKFLRFPGTIIVEFLPPIAPGMPVKQFLPALEEAIEGASDRLLVEGSTASPQPPLAGEASARIAALKSAT